MSLNETERACLKVSKIACYGLPKISLTKHSFYVVVTIDDQLRWTSTSKHSSKIQWDDELFFDTSMMDDGQISIQVCTRRTLGEDDIVGGFDAPLDISSLLNSDNSNKMEVKQALFNMNKNGQMRQAEGSVQMTLLRINSNETSLDLLTGVGNSISAMHEPRKTTKVAGAMLYVTGPGRKNIQTTYGVWKPLLLKIEAFVRIMDGVSDIYPYARIAWSVLSLPLKAIVAQTKRDKKIQGLLESINSIYSVVLKAKPFERIGTNTHRKTMQLMCLQTVECAFFIREYASRGFGERIAKSMTTDFDSKVEKYQQTFEQLKNDFLFETAIVVEITVFQMATKFDEILSEIVDANTVKMFDEMHYAKRPFKPERCFVGTRKTVIQNIIKWFSQPVDNEESRVYWLSGVAGCGKSAVARSVADQLLAQRRGVSFFFHASRQADCGPDRLFATLSRNLTEISDSWKSCLFKLLKQSPSARDCSTIEEQFENFLLGPAKMVENIGPVMIVIDALDEIGIVDQRALLIRVLKRLPELPPHFRFLITSRPETDIRHLLENSSWVFCNELNRSSPLETDLDIGLFVKEYLRDTPNLQKANIDEWAQVIVTRSEQLFQWAATACKYIRGKNGDTIGDNPNIRVAEILASSAYDGLDGLYRAILDRLSWLDPGDTINQQFQTILGRILSLREPPSMEILVDILSEEEDEADIRMILAPLGSLLSGVSQKNVPIQPLHLSFADFLKTESRSRKYWINMQEQEERSAKSLFRVMKSLLRFNICKLPTSYKRNVDVDDLQERISKNIPARLNYACRYWMDHLKPLPVSHEWLNHVNMLLYSHLLFWFEALSLLDKFSLALSQLADLRSWLSSSEDANKLQSFVEDAHRFGTAFGHVIRHSAPHLYLSALPFIPRKSPVSQAYLPKYPGCLNVVDTDKITWPQNFLSINVGVYISAVAFSPDGKRVASGSGYPTNAIQIWSADTGELLAGPFRGHTGLIFSVEFSSNGRQIVSCSYDKTVRIWNVDSGTLMAKPFQGHTKAVTSARFSPDSKRIVSGSEDHTVRVWNASSGGLVIKPFQGHQISRNSVGFSPDGGRVVFSSIDSTIKVLDIGTGEVTAKPLDSSVVSVVFSSDGKRVISSLHNGTITVWNLESGQLKSVSLQGHTGAPKSAAFSPNGKHVVSALDNRAIAVWDTDTGELVTEPLQGRADSIPSVGFSSDGKQVVSGSSDGTIRVWHLTMGKSAVEVSSTQSDVESDISAESSPETKLSKISKSLDERVTVQVGNAIAAMPLARAAFQDHEMTHTRLVTSVGFSSDGQRLVIGSSDMAVQVWDAETGEHVAGPFQGHYGSTIILVGFSPDGKRVISGSREGEIIIWNIDTGDVIDLDLESSQNLLTFHWSDQVAYSPDARRIASGSKNGEIKFWDTRTHAIVARSSQSQSHIGGVQSLAFSHNGKRAVSGSLDYTVRVWNTDTGRLLAEPFKGHKSVVSAVGFSPNGNQVVSGSWDYTIRVWNTDTGGLVAGPFQGHHGWITSLGFSPDGKQIVSGSDDNTVRLWHVGANKLAARPFQGHTKSVNLVAFSPNGNHIVSVSDDSTVQMWSPSYTTSSISTHSSFKSSTKSLSAPGFQYENGWILSNEYHRKLLFWIPEEFYPDIPSPERSFLLCSNALRLNVTDFSHGDAWAQCYKP